MDVKFSLQTNRLLIEPLAASDDGFIFELVNTEGWIEFIGNRNITSLTDACAYIQKIDANKNITYWVVKLRVDEVKIGVVTYLKRDFLKHADIGFAFLPCFSKQGYAYEAVSAVLHQLFQEHTDTHILAITLPQNISSVALLKKIGLVFEKEMEIENEKLHVYGVSVDQVIN